MSNRPVARSTAFANLKPTIIRQPSRSSVSAESEARLLDLAAPAIRAVTEEVPAATALPGQMPELLQRKRKPVLIPVTFRMPQPLKERLEKIAAKYEVNQTDLINEAIELNLRRYAGEE